MCHDSSDIVAIVTGWAAEESCSFPAKENKRLYGNVEQDRQRTCHVILRRVCVTIVAVEKAISITYMVSVCL